MINVIVFYQMQGQICIYLLKMEPNCQFAKVTNKTMEYKSLGLGSGRVTKQHLYYNYGRYVSKDNENTW